ncbi:hypothetical protein [Paenibacillus sp. NRS-1780]|uniref:hypothetical protein n=1 Tax=Paenibacillus sp. NRS-1780 TaxID=3233904 RepID=UPI003D284380
MKKLTMLFSIFALIFLLAVPTSFAAAADTNVAKFETHLKSLDQSDPFVKTQIEKYDKLSQSEKERFANLVYDPEVHKQAFGVIQTIQPLSQKNSTTTFANGDVVITGVADFGSSKSSVTTQGVSTQAAEYSEWGSYAWTMTFLGIDITTLKSKVFYTVNSRSEVLRSDSCVNTHSNIDPFIVVSDGTSSHFKSGGYAFGNGPFTVYGTPTLGFVSASVAIIVKSKPGDTYGWKESTD